MKSGVCAVVRKKAADARAESAALAKILAASSAHMDDVLQHCSLDDLPTELLDELTDFVPDNDLLAFALTCKSFRLAVTRIPIGRDEAAELGIETWTQPSAMFLGSARLREWAVSLGCPVPSGGAGGLSPFFHDLELFPGELDCATLRPSSTFPEGLETELTNEQWGLTAYCNPVIYLMNHADTEYDFVHEAELEMYGFKDRADMLKSTRKKYVASSNKEFFTVRDLVNAIISHYGGIGQDIPDTVWGCLRARKAEPHTFVVIWDS